MKYLAKLAADFQRSSLDEAAKAELMKVFVVADNYIDETTKHLRSGHEAFQEQMALNVALQFKTALGNCGRATSALMAVGALRPEGTYPLPPLRTLAFSAHVEIPRSFFFSGLGHPSFGRFCFRASFTAFSQDLLILTRLGGGPGLSLRLGFSIISPVSDR